VIQESEPQIRTRLGTTEISTSTRDVELRSGFLANQSDGSVASFNVLHGTHCDGPFSFTVLIAQVLVHGHPIQLDSAVHRFRGEPQKALRGVIRWTFLEPFGRFGGKLSPKVDQPAGN
jgi:hypothetical protein